MFSPSGDTLCRRCFYADQQRELDQKAAAAMQDDIAGVPVARLAEQPPLTWMMLGVVLMLVAVTVTSIGIVFFDTFFMATGALFLAGFSVFARGWADRRK
ncbi:MAG: hypothetical protein U0165_05470 [Polyangiaceae bacterium]